MTTSLVGELVLLMRRSRIMCVLLGFKCGFALEEAVLLMTSVIGEGAEARHLLGVQYVWRDCGHSVGWF